jgi:N-acetylmuramoyl-L-alanine amidase
MRKIKFIVLHCTAGQPNQKTESVLDYWKRVLKWKSVGYHKLVSEDGSVETLATDDKITNGVAGHNHHSIHICYKGGLKGVDTRTEAQKETLKKLVKEYKKKYPTAFVLGHRDLSPDLNKDGKITKNEWVKICPCFSATTEYNEI